MEELLALSHDCPGVGLGSAGQLTDPPLQERVVTGREVSRRQLVSNSEYPWTAGIQPSLTGSMT